MSGFEEAYQNEADQRVKSMLKCDLCGWLSTNDHIGLTLMKEHQFEHEQISAEEIYQVFRDKNDSF